MQEYNQSNTRLKAIINKGGTQCNYFRVYFDLLMINKIQGCAESRYYKLVNIPTTFELQMIYICQILFKIEILKVVKYPCLRSRVFRQIHQIAKK
jgi:hypothetical protein